MSTTKRTVLITGCSDGGMGAELAKEFQKAGLNVIATARDVSKMSSLTALGIQTLPLDISSESSIEGCVKKVPTLDILINNAGASYTTPISDLSLTEAKKLFDANLWGHIAMTQAFLPTLLKSPKAIIANHTSIGAGLAIPFQSTYNASKAALAMFTNTLRMELEPFDIQVIELRTAGVKTNIIKNVQAKNPQLPANSIYSPAKKQAEDLLRQEWAETQGIPAQQWAAEVVADLLKKKPPIAIWRGESATLAWIGSMLPWISFEAKIKSLTGMDKLGETLRKK